VRPSPTLGLGSASGVGRQYWRPDNPAYCTQCPRIYHGPTPRTRAEADELPSTLLIHDTETGELTARG